MPCSVFRNHSPWFVVSTRSMHCASSSSPSIITKSPFSITRSPPTIFSAFIRSPSLRRPHPQFGAVQNWIRPMLCPQTQSAPCPLAQDSHHVKPARLGPSATLAALRLRVSGFHHIDSREQSRPHGCFRRRYAQTIEKNQPRSYGHHLHLRGPVLIVARVATLHNAEISSGGAAFDPEEAVGCNAVVEQALNVEIGIVTIDIARRADESGVGVEQESG